MKKVLVVTNLFHASPRIPGICTYLPEFGWESTIITPPLGKELKNLGFPTKFLDRANIIQTPYSGDIFWFWRKIFKLLGYRVNESITEQIKEKFKITSKKSLVDILMNLYTTIFAYPDTERKWKKQALKEACEVLKKEHFDAILSSSPYPTYHIVAYELKSRFNIPWLADFRDLWTRNHNYPYCFIRKWFEEKLEKRILIKAEAITAATPSCAKKQEELLNKSVSVITNGFNPEILESPALSLTRKFTISYTGSIYISKQDPEKLFIALQKLILKKMINPSDIEVRFYGPKKHWLTNKINEYGLEKIAYQFGVISRQEAIHKQKESQILLLLNWEDPYEKGIYTTKLFEYLAAQRPILATGGFRGNDIEGLIIKTNSGYCATTQEEIEQIILNFYNEYKSNGSISFKGNLSLISKYSYHEKAKEFSFILNRICE